MESLLTDIPDYTCFFLATARQRDPGLFKKKWSPYGLTDLQRFLPEILWSQGRVPATELGKYLIPDKEALSGINKHFEDVGWIEKTLKKKLSALRLYLSNKVNNIKKMMKIVRVKGNDLLLADCTIEEELHFKCLL